MNKIQEQGRFKILMVDDEENILSSLKRLFFEEDYEVLTATSGREGLELLEKNDIAAIISDQKMPEISGTEFLARARKISPDSARIVLTGYADAKVAIEAINQGQAYAFITKPWDDNEVILTIKNAVERYGLVRENAHLAGLTKRQNEELKKWNEKLENCVLRQTIDLKKQNEELKGLNQNLIKNLKDSVTAFSNLIELRDKTVGSHSTNVAAVSAEMARKVGLEESEIEIVAIAAQLHDIGKIGIPDIALSKDFDELTREEMEEFQKHPVRGQAAIDFIEPLRTAGILIRYHHEWYDGSGFPDGLKGDKIPLGSRIIAMADHFDRALSQNAEPRAIEKAFDKVRALLEKQFDPSLYKVFREAEKERIAQTTPAKGTYEVEVTLLNLKSGMIISREVKSRTGLLLFSKGAVLDDGQINALMRRVRIDPPKSGIRVWMEDSQDTE